MYCKQCNGVLQADFFDQYATFCSKQCEQDFADKRAIGKTLRKLILVAAVVIGVFVFLTALANAEEEGHDLVPDVVVVEVTEPEPVFDADKADKMVVRITDLYGKPRGTGFYIGNDTVVTAGHLVLQRNRSATPFGYVETASTRIEYLLVWNKQGKVVIGKTQYEDHEQDVASLLLLNNTIYLMPVTFAESAPERGDKLFMIGHPFGIPYALSIGHLARQTYTMEQDGSIRGLASMMGTGGSSGSPVFNERGEVVGVLTENLVPGSGVLFVPISVFKDKVFPVEVPEGD